MVNFTYFGFLFKTRKKFVFMGEEKHMKNPIWSLKKTACFLGVFCLLLCGAFIDASGYELSNDTIRAEFSSDGLKSLSNKKIKKKIHFLKDASEIRIDSADFQSYSLGKADVSTTQSGITYSYDTSSYVIKIVYELEPSWHFISKQILVESKNTSPFTVNTVNVWNIDIRERVVEDYGIHSGKYGAFCRFQDKTGFFMLAQNPFLRYTRDDTRFSLSYVPEIEWKPEYGVFEADRGCLGVYELSGNSYPDTLLPVWSWTGGIVPATEKTVDWAEITAYSECVRAFILDHPEETVKIHVGWCENDYQIDASVASGREELKRIIKRASEMGCTHMLYDPANTLLSNRLEAADDWYWETGLWLSLGQKIRKGEWDPHTDPTPPSVQEMLDYAKSKNVKLVAYVYPSLPFSHNPEWLVGPTFLEKNLNSNLGYRSFQDWLIETMSEFYIKTGIGGYSFDYAFLSFTLGPNEYAQWFGWRRVLEALRTRFPEIVIDGRTTYQTYGPWIWLAGSYPHPLMCDEQARSFIPTPDLHFDRVSANYERYAAYHYRIKEYAPQELVPGYMTHQSHRYNILGELVYESFGVRDWDYLGWKYSLISSIGTAGINNVVNMIPARDPSEYRAFSEEDKRFFRKWLNWTDENREYLLRTRPILGQPLIGKTDGTSAIIGDRGYIFLYNPNYRSMNSVFSLDGSVGITKKGTYVLEEMYPVEGRLHGKKGSGFWSFGDTVAMPMDGTSAIVLKLSPAPSKITEPVLFGVSGEISVDGAEIILENVKGEIGTTETATLVLPGKSAVKTLSVNGKERMFEQKGAVLTCDIAFQGERCGQAHQLDTYDPNFEGGEITGTFTVPKRIFDLLGKRKTTWPIPWSETDYRVTWLVPERLLLYVNMAEPKDSLDVRLKIDGASIELIRAYSSIDTGFMQKMKKDNYTFVGFYADISAIEPDATHTFSLTIPGLKPGQYQGIFLENIEPEYTQLLE